MNLSEILKQETLQSRDVLREIGKRLTKFETDLSALIEQRRQRAQELKYALQEGEQFRSELDRIAENIDRVNDEICELTAKRQKLETHLEKTRESLSEREDGVSSCRSLYDDLQREISSRTKEKDQLDLEKSAIEERHKEECRGALGTYLDATETTILGGASDRQRILLAKRKFEKASSEDAEVQQLKKDWEQCKRFLSEIDPQAVSVAQVLKSQMQEVERRIEKQFPGALSRDVSEEDAEEPIELYSWHNTSSGRYVLFVPVPTKVWEQLQHDQQSPRVQHYLRLLFDIFLWLEKPSNVKFFSEERFLGLETEEDPSKKEGAYSEVEGKEVSFRFGQLPHEIEEALYARYGPD